MRKIFLRAGWRFVLFVIGAVGLQFLLLSALGLLHYQWAKGWDAVDFIVSEGLGIAATLITMAIAARLERRTFADYWMPFRPASAARWGEGFGWGVALVAATFALVLISGGVTIDGFALHGATLWRTAALWFAAMLLLGIYEESLFRGYPLVVLARGIGFWPASILMSVLFGALHYFTKPMENVTDAVTVGLLGLFTCLTIRRTGSIWFAAGFHTAFNFTSICTLGSPNTGNAGKPLAEHLLATKWIGPEWMTGGPRGLEASAFMFLTLGLAFLLFHLYFRGDGSRY
ncbi:MAG: protease family protein [Acidobacteriota bacterium]|jgi:membrane protease YdiL (CAAX protease family)|nr:protease family protein [Acidobacteriota bacterium]